jgi:hypothetical protein
MYQESIEPYVKILLLFWNAHIDVYLIFPLRILSVEEHKIINSYIKTQTVTAGTAESLYIQLYQYIFIILTYY